MPKKLSKKKRAKLNRKIQKHTKQFIHRMMTSLIIRAVISKTPEKTDAVRKQD